MNVNILRKRKIRKLREYINDNCIVLHWSKSSIQYMTVEKGNWISKTISKKKSVGYISNPGFSQKDVIKFIHKERIKLFLEIFHSLYSKQYNKRLPYIIRYRNNNINIKSNI